MESRLKKMLSTPVSSLASDLWSGLEAEEQLGILIFSLPSAGKIGVPVSNVDEILPVSPLHFMPAVPDYILGVMIWHLEIIAVVDIEKLLRISSPGDSKMARFLIMHWEESVFALKVPAVSDIVTISAGRMHKMPASAPESSRTHCFQGYLEMDKETISMLDLKELVKTAAENI